MQFYYAITPEELRGVPSPPRHLGWMASHFDPHGTGLTDLPHQLPPGGVLLLDDSLPIHGHDPNRIFQELHSCFDQLHFDALILDFQQPDESETAALVKQLTSLPCPVIVSSMYASPGAALLLPPPPVDTVLSDYLALWKGHPLWLELSPTQTTLQLTAAGAGPVSAPRPSGPLHQDSRLHCHYRISEAPDAVFFHLHRTPEDLKALLQEAEGLGVIGAVGLYQELGQSPSL